MAKYRIIFDGEEEDEVYDSYEEAEDSAMEMLSNYHLGGEILELSNPGDYPYNPDDEPDIVITEI